MEYYGTGSDGKSPATKSDLGLLRNIVGNPNALKTVSKASLVSAINELLQRIEALESK